MSTHISTDNSAEAERAAFEHWMINEAKIIVGSADPYPAGLERDYWRVWQAARRAPAPVADGLPTLPRYLLDQIGEYGVARTETIGQIEVQYRWEVLISYIKRYAADYALDAIAADRQARDSVPAAGAVQQTVAVDVHDHSEGGHHD